jgi:hypothetical protein
MIIAVDFDGTIVDDQFPAIGDLKPNAKEVLLLWKKLGYKLILWTCRNDTDPANNGRKPLSEAVGTLENWGIRFDAVNANVPGLGFCPAPKIYADVYVDDRSVGANIDWLEICAHVLSMACQDAKRNIQNAIPRTFPTNNI